MANMKPSVSEKTDFRGFLKLLRFDPFLFLVVTGFCMQSIAIIQLAEDKMCINTLHKPIEYCLTLATNHSDDVDARPVFVHASDIKTWQNVIIIVPSTIMSMFLGYWLDKYPHYLKTMMLLPCFGAIVQCSLLLLNAYFFKLSSWAIIWANFPFAISGGLVILQSSFATYVSWATPPEWSAFRFALLEIVFTLGYLGGMLIGGYILAMDPWLTGQVENYLGVLGVSFILLVIAAVFGITTELDKAPKADPKTISMSHLEVFRDVFKFSRVKGLIKPLFIRRQNSDRVKLLLLTLTAVIYSCVAYGDDAISLQFSQKVYGWASTTFSARFSTLNLVPAVCMLIAPQIFKLFSLGPGAVGLLGAIANFTGNLIHGTVLNSTGFTFTYIISGFSPLIGVGMKSLVAQIVDSNESGQIFTIINSLTSYTSILSVFIYTGVYNATLLYHPALIYNCVTVLLLVPATTFFWAELFWKKQKITEIDNSSRQYPADLNDNGIGNEEVKC